MASSGGPDDLARRRRFLLFVIPSEIVFAVVFWVVTGDLLAGIYLLAVRLAIVAATITSIAFAWLVIARLPFVGQSP